MRPDAYVPTEVANLWGKQVRTTAGLLVEFTRADGGPTGVREPRRPKTPVGSDGVELDWGEYVDEYGYG